MVTLRKLGLALGVLGSFAGVIGSTPPIEVGSVEWGRDFDAAVAESARDGKPVLAFFQEVPGCAGCRKFGAEVMSHSLIVEAIQREFVPVLIYNNRPGRDAVILKRYGEPAWNYQVVRFLDGEGNDLIPRRDRVWTRDALALRMIEALEAAGRNVPRYLEVAALENDTEQHREVAFAQACFWTGEALLGRLPGVITTEAGWLEGHEVTRVIYHSGIVTLEDLAEQAEAAGVADEIYTDLTRYRAAERSDQKRQIRGSALEDIELSPMQRTKVNAFAPLDMDAAVSWLTPSQGERLE